MADKRRILVIEDDPDMHDVLQTILAPAGFELTSCYTGPEGMESARTDKPDLILLDIMLSSPSEGFHLAYDLKQDEVLKDVPIIMISAIGKTMGMDYAKELGSAYVRADRFLDKPFDAETLRNMVAEVLAETGRGC
jgi:two-component system alkaline phosphatase synthesis response regulator PhoP